MRYLVIALLLVVFSSCKQKEKQPKLLLKEFAFSDNHWGEIRGSDKFLPHEYIDIDSVGNCRIMINRTYCAEDWSLRNDSIGYFKVKVDSSIINRLNRMFYYATYPEQFYFGRNIDSRPRPEIEDKTYYSILYSTPKLGKRLTTFPGEQIPNEIYYWPPASRNNLGYTVKLLLEAQLLKAQLELIIANATIKNKIEPFNISGYTNYVQQYFEDKNWLPPPPPLVKLIPPTSRRIR